MVYNDETITAAVAQGLATARDPSQPDDADRAPDKYARLSDDYRAGAWKHLREDGDLPQASKKAWGMVAETIKAICAQHGGIVHHHGSIWQVLRALAQLVAESGDSETEAWMRNSFHTARALHTNFYEDEETAEDVAAGLRLCEELSDRLYELFWPERPTA